MLEQKFLNNLRTRNPEWKCQAIMALTLDQQRLEATPVNAFMELLVGT